MKVFINPQETTCTLLLEGAKVVKPIQESPFYQTVITGSLSYILNYLNAEMPRDFLGACIYLSNVMWTLSLVEIIRKHGFVPRDFASWPLLAGRRVVDGLRRVSICAALGMESIEVENTIQTLYPWWSQAFKVDDDWIDVTFPPNFERVPGGRFDCQSAWEAFSPCVHMNGKSVLDLGCGPGFYCHRAIDAGAAAVTGIDRNKSVLQTTNPGLIQDVIAQAKEVAWLCGYDKKIRFAAADLNEFQTDQQWDIVLALRIHYHLSDPARFLGEATRCAKETLIVQCNPIHGFQAGNVQYTFDILANMWNHVTTIPHGQTPLLVCKEKK